MPGFWQADVVSRRGECRPHVRARFLACKNAKWNFIRLLEEEDDDNGETKGLVSFWDDDDDGCAKMRRRLHNVACVQNKQDKMQRGGKECFVDFVMQMPWE